MERIARKSDGRRIFTAAYKEEQIARVLRGELTLTELSKKLGIARSLLQRWKRMATETSLDGGAGAARKSPVRKLPDGAFVRELQLLVGKQALELELLRAELDARLEECGLRRPSGR